MDRTNFYPRGTTYLFSFDVDLADRARDLDREEDVNAGNLRDVLIAGHTHELDEHRAPVYNALSNLRELGERSIRGHVGVFEERVDFPPGHEFGELRGRLLVRTDDGETLEGSYAGVFRMGAEWHWLNAAAARDADDRAHAQAASLSAKAFISMQFEVGSTKYAWLARYQCVGYGRLTLRGGCPSFATFDVYALDPARTATMQSTARAS